MYFYKITDFKGYDFKGINLNSIIKTSTLPFLDEFIFSSNDVITGDDIIEITEVEYNSYSTKYIKENKKKMSDIDMLYETVTWMMTAPTI